MHGRKLSRMGNNLSEEDWILRLLLGSAYFSFPIKKSYYRRSGGMILVAEDKEEADKIFDFLSESSYAVVSTLKEKKIHACNFHFVMHRYRKCEKIEKIQEFMEKTDFFPVLLVAGILPDELGEYGMIFRWRLSHYNFAKLKKLEDDLYDYGVNNTDYMLKRLKQFRTSKCMMKLRGKEKNRDTLIWSAAIGDVWKEIFRKNNMSEEEVECWFCSYLNSAMHAIAESDRIRECFDSDSAVRTCVLRAVEQGEIIVHDIRENQNLGNEILYSEDYYFIPEQLLKKICSPLLETASFVQIKKELSDSGMLESNNVGGNYTVKISCYNPETKNNERFRFLKINKKNLLTDEGLKLEDLEAIQK